MKKELLNSEMFNLENTTMEVKKTHQQKERETIKECYD